jgi:NADH dehydrogenase [ubiquinone] 1 alpha subcomplex assembly factor 2
MIEAIEARETAERIRQGYLADPALEAPSTNPRLKSIPGPSQAQLNGRPSFTQPDRRPISQTGQDGDSATSAPSSTAQGRRKVDSTSREVPAPGQPVDPLKHDDPAELRRLAEEDTKRRIEERGGEADLREKSEGVEGVNVGAGGGGLAPRRRGKQ